MNHKQQHHERKKKQREEDKEEQKLGDDEWEKQTANKIHPAWFMALGIVLIVMVILTWTLLLS